MNFSSPVEKSSEHFLKLVLQAADAVVFVVIGLRYSSYIN